MARRTRHEALIMSLLAQRSIMQQHRWTAAQGPDPEGRTWYRIENAANAAGPVDVYLYAEIGMWGVTADAFLDELAPLGARDITLRINSEGGEVFDGVAIYNALQRHGGQIKAHVDGLAASAASFIAMAADEIVMEPGSQMMIHDAMGLCFGNASEARKLADMLDRTSDTIAMIYAERAGGEAGAWRETMRGEKWYDGAGAVAAGLADRVGEGRPRGQSRPDNRAPAGQGQPVAQPVAYYGEAPGERDEAGRFKDGMPDAIASYALDTAAGVLTATRTQDGVRLDDGGNSVTLSSTELRRVERAMSDDYASSETLVTRLVSRDGSAHSVVVARVRPGGQESSADGESVASGMRLDVGEVDDPDTYDARAGVQFTSAQARRFAETTGRAEVAARVQTGYGPLDMFPSAGGDGMALRMKSEAGPTEVEFSRSEWRRINSAVDTVIDGTDESSDAEINKVTVSTKAGRVDVEWKGDRSPGRGYPADSRLLITPQGDAAWSVVIDGEHMSDVFDRMSSINEAIGVVNRVSHAGLPIAWADHAADMVASAADPDDWSAALIALTTPQPVSSPVDDHLPFWETT